MSAAFMALLDGLRPWVGREHLRLAADAAGLTEPVSVPLVLPDVVLAVPTVAGVM